jgi:predicted DNA-binding transcriptional regulator YafY
MNRIDRLFAILLHLQYKKHIRAQDLADEFEVSKRTIYRDLTALVQMGVPLVPKPGEGYSLVEGYYLPPLIFSAEEAGALFLGTQMLLHQAAGNMLHGAKRALEKITIGLPKGIKMEIEHLVDIVKFIAPKEKFNLDHYELRLVKDAIKERQVLAIEYHSFRGDASTKREIEPLNLYYAEGIWYVEAYCRLREGHRTFRFDRIDEIKRTRKVFSPKISPENTSPSALIIELRFHSGVVRWVRERQHYGYDQDLLVTQDKSVVMRYKVEGEAEVRSWILSWGANVEVLSPESLRETIKEEMDKVRSLYT